MDIKLIIFLITLTYIGYYVVSKIALRHYTEKTILVLNHSRKYPKYHNPIIICFNNRNIYIWFNFTNLFFG